MSFERTLRRAPFDPPPGKPPAKGPNGRGICRWCGQEVSGRRICWCSDACVHEYLLRARTSYARGCVRKRDRGKCRECGVDTYLIRRQLRLLIKLCFCRRKLACLYCIWAKVWADLAGWDMDHILPVEQGGGCCGLDNLQTLCRRCHKRKTRLQAQGRQGRSLINMVKSKSKGSSK